MSGTHGLIQHRTGYYYTILEEDYCEAFKGEGKNEVCRAYIVSILEQLTNRQFERTGSDEDIWVYMSIPEMARRMRHACSERTIHKELTGMIKDDYLAKRRAVGKATMEYKVNFKKINQALAALPDKQSCNSARYLLANLQEPSGNSARSTLQNYKNDLAELQPRINRDIPENKQEEQESTFTAIPTSPTSSSHDEDAHALSLEQERMPTHDAHTPSPVIQSEPPHVSASQLSAGDATRPQEGKQEASLIASTTPSASQPEPSKAARKPRAKPDELLKARIERVYGYFDKLGQEITGEKWRYHRTKRETQAITEWLTSHADDEIKPSEETLRTVYIHLWKKPKDLRGDFCWQDNMTIHAVLNNYDATMLAIKAKQKRPEPEQKPLQEEKSRGSVFIAGVGYQEPVILPYRPAPQPKKGFAAR